MLVYSFFFFIRLWYEYKFVSRWRFNNLKLVSTFSGKMKDWKFDTHSFVFRRNKLCRTVFASMPLSLTELPLKQQQFPMRFKSNSS